MESEDDLELNPRSARELNMSYEEYLEWCDEDTVAEWVNGRVIVQPPHTLHHQKILGWLSVLLGNYAESFDLGIVLIAPFEMRLNEVGSSRMPDLWFLAKENRRRLQPERLNGPADLIIEILDPDSILRDRNDKFLEYRRAGVREYWVIDSRPDRPFADFYRLDDKGEYDLYATEVDERVESLVLPGFWLRPAWLFAEDRISTLAAFLEMLSPEQRERFRKELDDAG